MAEKRRCDQCEFFQAKDKAGECRRYPPKADVLEMIGRQGEVVASYPPVKLDGWCGEFKKREA